MKSMTGFGKAESINDKRKTTIEIRTLNSKQADIFIKTPGFWKDREPEIRLEAIAQLQRGKIEINIYFEDETAETVMQFNQAAIMAYYRQLSDIAATNNIPLPQDILASIVRMPDVLKLERSEPDENEWKLLLEGIRSALKQVNEFRQQEGLAIKDDITTRIRLIEAYINDIEIFEPQRLEVVKNRLRQNLTEHLSEIKIDQNRFEQELIYYIDKLDINEEKVRLRNHCSFFVGTVNDGDGNGKKLGFIAQEMGREINTIGSKSYNVEMQQIVIQMKDELEKIKELLLNVL